MWILAFVILGGVPAPLGTSMDTVSSPATQLSLKLGEVFASRTESVALVFDASIETTAVESIRDAVARAGLFSIALDVRYRAVFRRDDDKTMTMVMLDRDTPMEQLTIDWQKSLKFRESKESHDNSKLTLVVANPLEFKNVQTRYPKGFDPYLSPNVRRGPEAGFRAPSAAPERWAVIDSEGKTLNDIELARRLDDIPLEEELLYRQARRRRIWSWGFAGAALVSAGAGTAVLLSADGGSSREVLGLSLLGTGVVAGIVAILNKNADRDHILSIEQSAELVRVNNERSAERSRKTPDDGS